MIANVIVAASNLYACFVISTLYCSGSYWGAFIFFCSMVSSCIFHLIETDEVVRSLPRLFESQRARVALSGAFGEPFFGGEILLLMDRVFAMGCVVYVCHSSYRRMVHDKLRIEWERMMFQLSGGVIFLLCSDLLSQTVRTYAVIHSLWHICAYDIAYNLCHITNPSWWSKEHTALK
jgi:hypothetical protein